MSRRDTLTLDEHMALARFAHGHGRTWRADLRWLWEHGWPRTATSDANERALLQSVRNKLGPSGLGRYKPARVLKPSDDQFWLVSLKRADLEALHAALMSPLSDPVARARLASVADDLETLINRLPNGYGNTQP